MERNYVSAITLYIDSFWAFGRIRPRTLYRGSAPETAGVLRPWAPDAVCPPNFRTLATLLFRSGRVIPAPGPNSAAFISPDNAAALAYIRSRSSVSGDRSAQCRRCRRRCRCAVRLRHQSEMNPRRRQVANSLRRDRASSLHLSHSDAETEQYEQHIA